MHKSKWVILFTVIVSIIVVVPVSLYYYEIDYAKQPVKIDRIGDNTSHVLSFLPPNSDPCCNRSRSSSSTIFSSPHGGMSFINMTLGVGASDFECGSVSGWVNLTGSIQPGLHPSSLTVNFSSSVKAPYNASSPTGKSAYLSIHGVFYPILTNMSVNTPDKSWNFQYASLSNENASCNFRLLNDSNSNTGRYYFSVNFSFISLVTGMVTASPGTYIYTQITFTLNGFSKPVPVIIGFKLVGDKS